MPARIVLSEEVSAWFEYQGKAKIVYQLLSLAYSCMKPQESAHMHELHVHANSYTYAHVLLSILLEFCILYYKHMKCEKIRNEDVWVEG